MTDITPMITAVTALVVAIGHLLAHVVSKNRTNAAAKAAALTASAQLKQDAVLAAAKVQSDAIATAVAKALAAAKGTIA